MMTSSTVFAVRRGCTTGSVLQHRHVRRWQDIHFSARLNRVYRLVAPPFVPDETPPIAGRADP